MPDDGLNASITQRAFLELKELLDRQIGSRGPIEIVTVKGPVGDIVGNPYRVQLTLTVEQVSGLHNALVALTEKRARELEDDIVTLYDLATDMLTTDERLKGERTTKLFVDEHIRQLWSSRLEKDTINATIASCEDQWNDYLSDKR